MTETYANQSDEILAKQAGQGVLDAFDELVRRYQHRVYGFIHQVVSNPTDAREVTQDAFFRAFAALEQFRSGASFSAWLFSIARNKAIDHLRSRQEVSGQAPPDNPDYDDPSVLLARREDQSQIWGLARQMLPELHFQVVWLRYVEDMDVAQIAAVIGKTRTHVKVILFRSRRILAGGLGATSGGLADDRAPALRKSPGVGIKSAPKQFCDSRRASAPTL